MYQDFFGLHEKPFSIAPDPRYLYMTEQHREALAHLLFGVGDEGGFILLTGEVGTGKTTICRSLLNRLPDNTDVAFIVNPRLSVYELLQSICDDLSIVYPDNASIKDLVDALNQFLLNAKIIKIQFNVPKLRWAINPELKKIFLNTIILKIDRIGKYILINTSNKNTLIFHLGMSGYLSIKEENFKNIKHDHIIINFLGINGKKKSLIFNDQRRFGHIDFHNTSSLGKHFLIKRFSFKKFARKILCSSQIFPY